MASAPEHPPSVHAYCRTGAVCVAYVRTRASERTVVLEFAASAAAGRYNWANKVAFQLNRGELAELCAFLFFPWERVKWVHQNEGVTKGLEICHQPPNLLFSLSIGGRPMHVPVLPKDQYFIRNLVLARLLKSQPPLPERQHLASLKHLAEQKRGAISQ